MNWYQSLKLAMPLRPDAYKLYGPGQVHRLRQHSGFDQILDHRSGQVRNVPNNNPVSPQQQAQIDQLYSGTHASMSPEVAAIYANNNSTPQDPPVILAFVSTEQWRPDVDTDGPEPNDILEKLNSECPDARQIATQPYNAEAVESLMQDMANVYSDNYDESYGDPDLLDDISKSHRNDTITAIPEFYKHYYGEQAAEMFYREFLVPIFSGEGYDSRVQAFMTNQMRFMQAVPDEHIVGIGTTERFSRDYADDEEFDPDNWDEEDGEMPELDDQNRRMYDDEGRTNIYYHDDPFNPHVQWVWQSPEFNNGRVFYHGTVKSRALRALPQMTQVINQIK